MTTHLSQSENSPCTEWIAAKYSSQIADHSPPYRFQFICRECVRVREDRQHVGANGKAANLRSAAGILLTYRLDILHGELGLDIDIRLETRFGAWRLCWWFRYSFPVNIDRLAAAKHGACVQYVDDLLSASRITVTY